MNGAYPFGIDRSRNAHAGSGIRWKLPSNATIRPWAKSATQQLGAAVPPLDQGQALEDAPGDGAHVDRGL